MKHSLKFFRCSFVLLLTLIVAVSAAIGVSADATTLTNYLGYDHIYKDSQGVIILSKSTLYALPVRNGSAKLTTLSQAEFIGFTSQDSEPLLVFLPQYNDDKIIYKFYVTQHVDQGILVYDMTNTVQSGQLNTTVSTFDGSYAKKKFPAYFYFKSFYGMDNTNFFASYTYTSNYHVYDRENNTNNNIPSATINPDYTIDDALGSNGISTDDIINAIDIALNNNQNIVSITENIDILINYGSDFNQIDSNLIGNLGNAEDQLSSAEGALENKSQSLKDSVASQWQTIQTTSKTFITNLAPAAAAVGTVTTQFIEAAPDEVKGLFVTIPLIIFIGWLIGRIRGD